MGTQTMLGCSGRATIGIKTMQREDEYMPITIVKPLPGNRCSIDFRKLKEAVQDHKLIKLTLMGIGTAIVDPLEWFKTADKIEERKVNYPTPMKFVYNTVKIQGILTKTKNNVTNQQSLF